MRPIPKHGEIYKHFKGGLYKILCVGHHSETKEKMVVYVHCQPDSEPCIRPFAMFMSEVDRSKYPEVEQKYRFELME